ncbi:MAG: hypothetical protein F6K39_14860 [Okeania sp. SIO3B3]|nr:hypothetical protein [Okeania sp. SIO3B3]
MIDDKQKMAFDKLIESGVDSEVTIEFAKSINEKSVDLSKGFFQGSGGRKFILTNVCILIMILTLFLDSYFKLGLDLNTCFLFE